MGGTNSSNQQTVNPSDVEKVLQVRKSFDMITTGVQRKIREGASEKDIVNAMNALSKMPPVNADEWHSLKPDQWSEQFRATKVMAWKAKYADVTFLQFYEYLIRDEGYWHEVNNLIANLPPEPTDKVHSSVIENFYGVLLPWRGVCQDWLNDSSVTATQTVTENGNTFQRPIRTVFHYDHKRPQGMGLELSALNAKYKVEVAAGTVGNKIIAGAKKLTDTWADVLDGIGGTSNLLNPRDNPNATLSFTTIVLGLGGIAIAALIFK